MEAATQKAQLTSLINRLKLVILSPKECWQTIANQDENPTNILTHTIIPVVVAGTICSIVGLQVFGLSIGALGTWRPPLVSFTLSSIVAGISQIVTLYIGAFLVQKLAPLFQGQASPSRAFSLVSHAALPGLFASVLTLYPPLGILGVVLAVVSLYALFQGIPKMTTVTEDKRLAFAAAFIASMILISLALAVVSGTLVSIPSPGQLEVAS
jgi:hypothetical protein